MSQHPGQPPHPKRTVEDMMRARVERRRRRVRAGISRTRAGQHVVPTWVLALVVGLVALGWLYLILTR